MEGCRSEDGFPRAFIVHGDEIATEGKCISILTRTVRKGDKGFGWNVRAPGIGSRFGVGEKFDLVRLSSDKGRLRGKLLLVLRCGTTLRRFEAITLKGSVGWRSDTGEADLR